MSIILGTAVALVFAGIVAFGIYFLIYTIIVNRRIERGITTEGPLFDTSKVLMVVAIAVLLILLVANRMAANDPAQTTRNSYCVIDVSDPEHPLLSTAVNRDIEDDVSYVKAYSKDENPGYAKDVLVDGDFTFTVFVRTGSADEYHPDFLCFAEYTGDETYGLTTYYTEGFDAFNDDAREGYGGAGGDMPEQLLYIGNLDEDCAFVATICVLDKEAQAAFDEAFEQWTDDGDGELPDARDFADHVSGVRITL